MVLLDNNFNEPNSIHYYYYGECDSLLANCCSKTPLSSPFKFRTMSRQRRQVAFEALRQMKLQQQTEFLSTRSKRRRNKKRFYKALCCTDLHISESHSNVCTPTMAADKSKSRISSSGLTNEFYFASHKPDGDNEKTSPVLMRNKRRSSQLNTIPVDNTSLTATNRRPKSSPVRSTTYVLQQHHRINNNHNNVTNKKISSTLHRHQQPSTKIPMTLNNNRQVQQQRINFNHERLPVQMPSTVDSSARNHQLTCHTHITLKTCHTSPIVKNASIKTPAYTSGSPRIASIPPIRPSRPELTAAPPLSLSTAARQQRSPCVQLRPSSLIPTPQRTTSSSPATRKPIRSNPTSSKSPEELRRITGTVTCPRTEHTVVSNKPKLSTPNTTPNTIKNTRAPTTVQSASLSSTTPRVSDIDALMAEKQINNNKTPPNTKLKSTNISTSPIANNIRRSLFLTDSVKVVRPVGSHELKIFSCPLPTETLPGTLSAPLAPSNELSCESNNDEKLSTLTPTSLNPTTDKNFSNHEAIIKDADSSSNISAVTHDLSEDSLNEHYQIKKLLNTEASIVPTKNDNMQINLSNNDILVSSSITSWSQIRSSCESNMSHTAALKSEMSTSPACYNGPIRQEDILMADNGRYFLLIDDNLSSDERQSDKNKSLSSSSSLSRSISPLIKTSIALKDDKSLVHRLVFPSRLGRILFYRRILSDSDIYQKNCSKHNEIEHNVYHLDTVRDYSMEFYMLTTYGSDSQLRAWLDNYYDDLMNTNNTCYFDDNRYQSYDDDGDDDELGENGMKMLGSNDSTIRQSDLNRLQADEELDWYSELESFNLSSPNQPWKNENASSCSSEIHVGELLRAEQFSVSSLTTTTSIDSSDSIGLISASWPLTNGIRYPIHSSRSSQSLISPPLSNFDGHSNTILKEILTYPWINEVSNSNINSQETRYTDNENNTAPSVVPDEFQHDFYYLCPLKNTTSFLKTDEQFKGIPKQLSHDV